MGSTRAFAVLGAVFLALCLPARADLILTSDGGGADARVRYGLPDTNFGASEALRIQNGAVSINDSRKTYLRFDLSGLGGAFVYGASLLLTPANDYAVGSGVTFDLYGLNDLDAGESWGESTITWNNAPANNTSSASAVLAAQTSSLGSYTFSSDLADGTPIIFSSSAIASFLNADTDGVVTFILTKPTQGTGYDFYSKESPDNEDGPTLQVSLVPEPASLLLLGCGALLAFAFGARRKSRATRAV